MEYIEFTVHRPDVLKALTKQLRSFFSEQTRKHGSNHYGLLPKPSDEGVVKTLRVMHRESAIEVIKSPRILKLISENGIKFDIKKIDLSVTTVNAVSVTRDRSFEKKSPTKALSKFNQSAKTQNDLISFKQKVKDYVTTVPCHLPFVSSGKHQYSLFFKFDAAQLPLSEFINQDFKFNTYGLSTSQNRVFLPNFKLED